MPDLPHQCHLIRTFKNSNDEINTVIIKCWTAGKNWRWIFAFSNVLPSICMRRRLNISSFWSLKAKTKKDIWSKRGEVILRKGNYFLPNISYVEEKYFVQNSGFFHQICQLHDEAKARAKKFIFTNFPNFPLNPSSFVVFLEKIVDIAKLDLIAKKWKKNRISMEFCIVFDFLVRIMAFQQYFRKLEGGKYPRVNQTYCSIF